jgi:hypothetical protein
MFTLNYYREYNCVSLQFKNDILEIWCRPENIDRLCKDGYDSAPNSKEHFSFFYDEEKIKFFHYGGDGDISISFRMTKEIRESLEIALNEWREIIKEE